MDGTILIALVIMGFIALIVAIVTMKSQQQTAKRKVEMLDVFNRIVLEEKLNISNKEILRHSIFGIDEVQKVLLVVQNHNDVQYDIIRLNVINDCHVKRSGTRITEQKKSGKKVSEEHINQVFLSLTLESKPVVDILVYSELHDGILEKQNLTVVAEKWKDIVRRILVTS